MIVFVLEKVDGLLLFFVIMLDQIKLVVEKVIVYCKVIIEQVVVSNQYIYKNVVDSIDEVDDVLNKIWLFVLYMNLVVSSDELCKVYDDCLLLFFEYGIWVG